LSDLTISPHTRPPEGARNTVSPNHQDFPFKELALVIFALKIPPKSLEDVGFSLSAQGVIPGVGEKRLVRKFYGLRKLEPTLQGKLSDVGMTSWTGQLVVQEISCMIRGSQTLVFSQECKDRLALTSVGGDKHRRTQRLIHPPREPVLQSYA
ncbi:hypothetical protein BaRGS_00023056, partial [Batillaria attramentaria]